MKPKKSAIHEIIRHSVINHKSLPKWSPWWIVNINRSTAVESDGEDSKNEHTNASIYSLQRVFQQI